MLTLSIVFVSFISFNLAAPLDESTKITGNKRGRDTAERSQVRPIIGTDDISSDLEIKKTASVREIVAIPGPPIMVLIITEEPPTNSTTINPVTTTTINPVTTTTIDPSIRYAPNPNTRWPNGRVYYVIDSQYDNATKLLIRETILNLASEVNARNSTCLQFISRTNETNYINIHPGNGCKSYMGMRGTGRQNVSIGLGCKKKMTIKHELIHALGFNHEHVRYDRDRYININWTNIPTNYLRQFQTRKTPIMNTTYDFESIMHYPPFDFAINGEFPVLSAKPGEGIEVKMGQQLRLSDQDVLKIQRWYGCTEDTSNIIKPVFLVKCHFTRNMCSLLQTGSVGLPWIRTRGGNGTVPHAGISVGADPYLVAAETVPRTLSYYYIWTPQFSGGDICVDIHVFQSGPLSFLYLRIEKTTNVQTYSLQGKYTTTWKRIKLFIAIPSSVSFKVRFESTISEGFVALDDVMIYRGPCL